MRWSFKIARIAGIDVRVHATFFLLFALIAYNAATEKMSQAAVTDMVLFTMVTFVIVVMHEYGHALTARCFGIRTKDITLLPIGGLARLDRMPEKPSQELMVAIAGPAVNVVLCGICVAGLAATGRLEALFSGDFMNSGWLVRLALVNGILAVFNLLPAFPMDGGRVLRALLSMYFDPVLATTLAARLGQVVAVIFVGVGVFVAPMFALIGLFVWVGAGEENRQSQFRATLAGIPVWHAAATEIRTLASTDTLERAALLVMRGTQTEFPVVEGERPVGILTRPALVAAIGRAGLAAPVALAMTPDFPIVAPNDPLDRAYLALMASPSHTAVVVQDGRLIGILTPEDIGELAAVQGAMAEAARRGFPPPAPPQPPA
ncbi:MAG: site-2 protease family protein [Planctomycetes bacterium]|nr:site-2 protease family protein [Planctomycetota bacterium]